MALTCFLTQGDRSPEPTETCVELDATDPTSRTGFDLGSGQFSFPATTSNVPDANPPETIGQDPAVTSGMGGGSRITTKPTTAAIVTKIESSGSATTGSALVATSVFASPTTVAEPVPVSSGNDKGVSKGAVAGIAIGTSIVGAVIAFLVAFFLFKRREKKKSRNGGMGLGGVEKYESSPELMSLSKGDPGPMYTQREVGNMSTMHLPAQNAMAVAALPSRRSMDLGDGLAGILPPPADDATIASKIATLFDQMHLHVDNFYRDVHASITASMEGDLMQFGTGLGEGGMVELLQSVSQPTTAIKHALVGYVLSKVMWPEDGNTRGNGSFFPREVVGLGASERERDLSPAYSLYRRLSVHLHTSTSAPHSSPSLQSAIREAAEHFALTFFPWANPGFFDHEKDEDLVQIMSNALDLMIWLYGQPSAYEFLWESVGRRGMLVAPGLVKVTDGNGRSSMQPRVLLEPAVVQG